MYIEKLKQLYYQERKALESLWIYEKESEIRLLQKRKDMIERAQKRLRMTELLGRGDITDQIKDDLLRANQEKVEEQIEKCADEELKTIDNNEKDVLDRANYSADEYAQYLFQLEKVFALEDALSEERLFPDAVYEEQRFIAQKKENGNT